MDNNTEMSLRAVSTPSTRGPRLGRKSIHPQARGEDCASPAGKGNVSAGNPRVVLPDGWIRIVSYDYPREGLPVWICHERLGVQVHIDWTRRTFGLGSGENWHEPLGIRRVYGRGWHQKLIDHMDDIIQRYISKEDGR